MRAPTPPAVPRAVLLALGLLLAAPGPAGASAAGPTGPTGPTGPAVVGVANEVDGAAGERPELPGLEPVEGGAGATPVAPIEAGRYVDVLPEDPEDQETNLRGYEFTRTIPGSTVHFGVTFLEPVPASSRASLAMIRPSERERDSTVCGAVVRVPGTSATSMPLVSYGGSSFPRKRACAEAETLRVGVAATGERAVPPGTPYELSIWEEPPPTNLDRLPLPAFSPGPETFEPADPAEVTSAVDPGPSKPEATPVEPDGAVHVDLPLGEVAWFAVPLAAGEILAVDAAVRDADLVDQGATFETRILSPVGGFAGEVLTPGVGVFDPAYGPAGVVGTGTTRTQIQTYSTGPGALRLLAAPDFTNGASFDAGPLIATAGVYYVAVHAQDLVGEDGATLPMTLTTRTWDLPGAFGAEPEYDGAGPEPLPGPAGDVEPEPYDGAAATADLDRRVAAREQRDAEAAADGTVPWWTYLLGAAAVLLLAVGGFALARARRIRDRRRAWDGQGPGRPPGLPGPPGPPGPPWPGGPGGPGPGGPGGRPPHPGPDTPPTRIRSGPHPGLSGEGPTPWSGRPGEARPPRAPGRWDPPPGG